MTNRSVIFRGKCLKTNEWVYGYYIQDKDGNHIICEYANWRTFTFSIYFVNAESLGQFTGLSDNGIDVYEGDVIIKGSFIKYIDGRNEHVGTAVGFYHFCDRWVDELVFRPEDGITVIGNKFDNPELL